MASRRNLGFRSQQLRDKEQQTETDTDAECEGEDLVCIGDPHADTRDTTTVQRSSEQKWTLIYKSTQTERRHWNSTHV
jgi:predicted aconitase